jgi:hypothetical protein
MLSAKCGFRATPIMHDASVRSATKKAADEPIARRSDDSDDDVRASQTSCGTIVVALCDDDILILMYTNVRAVLEGTRTASMLNGKEEFDDGDDAGVAADEA